MYTITARNVNEALPIGMMLLREAGIATESRGIKVIEYPMPVATTYLEPRERVLFNPKRDANPFFHFMEALWIIAGRNDVAWLERFLPRMKDYSDDGKTFHGAYGYRLRGMPYHDQIAKAVQILKAKPDSRQVVLQIWDTIIDLGANTKDTPCNDMVFLKIRNNRLYMTVCCRSNDIIWGAYGANVVQFSMLQEYIAAHIGCDVGPYTQFSDSFHVYPSVPFWNEPHDHVTYDYYSDESNAVHHYPLFAQPELFDEDLQELFYSFDDGVFKTVAFNTVVMPMIRAHNFYHDGDLDSAIAECYKILADDWRLACKLWLLRRKEARNAR